MTTEPTVPLPGRPTNGGDAQAAAPTAPAAATAEPAAAPAAPAAPTAQAPGAATPTGPAATTLGPAAGPGPVPAAAQRKRTGPRTSPIVFGALILAFCAYVGTRTFGTGVLDTAGWITAVVIGLGVLLLVVSGAILVRGRRRD